MLSYPEDLPLKIRGDDVSSCFTAAGGFPSPFDDTSQSGTEAISCWPPPPQNGTWSNEFPLLGSGVLVLSEILGSLETPSPSWRGAP